MIRATALSLVDQGLLSAVNFALGLVLIRFATQEEYGLYTQLIGLQALFSVLHAGLFVSAFLSRLPHLEGAERAQYRAAMARAELGVTLVSCVLVAVLTWGGARLAGFALSPLASIAAAFALLALWWREFVRAGLFAEMAAGRVLWLDAGYALVVALALVSLIVAGAVSAAGVLACLALGGTLVSAGPILSKLRESRVDFGALRRALGTSWSAARWEVVTSLVTFGHAQTFVFFAALQGGLRAAAAISAGRLIVMPLALAWTSYANVLRPWASRVLVGHDAVVEINRLALRSVLLVLAVSLAYALVLAIALPLLDRMLFAGQFPQVATLAYWWLAYFSLAGMTTIATSLLRSSFEFRGLFFIHAACAALALLAFCAGLAFPAPVAFVVGLVLVEAVLAGACWSRLRRVFARPSTFAAADSATGLASR